VWELQSQAQPNKKSYVDNFDSCMSIVAIPPTSSLDFRQSKDYASHKFRQHGLKAIFQSSSWYNQWLGVLEFRVGGSFSDSIEK